MNSVKERVQVKLERIASSGLSASVRVATGDPATVRGVGATVQLSAGMTRFLIRSDTPSMLEMPPLYDVLPCSVLPYDTYFDHKDISEL
jgi:hypothetical protein